jgi:hypothetical protein
VEQNNGPCIPSPVLFNILFDFIVKKVIDEVAVSGVKFSYGSNDFFHGRNEKHDDFHILALLYADDLVVMCETAVDLDKFVRSFEKVTQQFGLTMSIKKTCLMSLQQLKEDQHKKVLKGQNVNYTDIDIKIRNQRIETADSYTCLSCTITKDQRQDTEISVRLTKAAKAFNTLRHGIWHRKSVSITARLRIFRACVLPVLLGDSTEILPLFTKVSSKCMKLSPFIELFVLIILVPKKLGIALEIVKNDLKYFTRFFIKNFMVWNIIV